MHTVNAEMSDFITENEFGRQRSIKTKAEFPRVNRTDKRIESFILNK